jgi:hypothetical protein
MWHTEKRKSCRNLVRKLDGKEHFEDQGVDGNIKSGYKVGNLRLDSCGFGDEQAADCGKECNEPSGSTKGGKLITFPGRNGSWIYRGAISSCISHVCVCEREREGGGEEEGGGGLELDISQHI